MSTTKGLHRARKALFFLDQEGARVFLLPQTAHILVGKAHLLLTDRVLDKLRQKGWLTPAQSLTPDIALCTLSREGHALVQRMREQDARFTQLLLPELADLFSTPDGEEEEQEEEPGLASLWE